MGMSRSNDVYVAKFTHYIYEDMNTTSFDTIVVGYKYERTFSFHNVLQCLFS